METEAGAPAQEAAQELAQEVAQDSTQDSAQDVTPDSAEMEADALWWAHVPDFLKPGYPLDIPPARLPFVRHVFTEAGAPAHCPEPRCRRGKTCRGGDGPPCYRADRRALQQVLFLGWARLFLDLPEAECVQALRRTRNRYAPAAPEGPARRGGVRAPGRRERDARARPSSS